MEYALLLQTGITKNIFKKLSNYLPAVSRKPSVVSPKEIAGV